MALNRRGGLHDDTSGSNFMGAFMIEDYTDSSVTYYSGREVDTGCGETGHGATTNGISWVDTGFPPETSFILSTASGVQRSLRAGFSTTQGGDARVGAYRIKLSYKGRSEETVILNEHRNGEHVTIMHYITVFLFLIDSDPLYTF